MKETRQHSALRAWTTAHRNTPFTLTPGHRRVFQSLNRSTMTLFRVPVVLLERVDGDPIVKLHDGTVALFRGKDIGIFHVTPHVWARCLWNLTTNQRKAAA